MEYYECSHGFRFINIMFILVTSSALLNRLNIQITIIN